MRNREVKVGFTGTREILTQAQFESLVIVMEKNLDVISEIHHGDCVGADHMFVEMTRQLSREIKIIQHPPLNDSLRAFTYFHEQREALDYITRNHNIVDESHLMIACPGHKVEVLRSGTWATIRYAKKTKTDIILIYPDGSHELIQHDKNTREKLPINRT